MPTVEIFSQGEEVITGQTADTNAAWLSERLFEMGFNITRHTAVGDRLDDLVSLLREIATRADCCICTGGLGPTQDDLTADAVSTAFDRPLVFDPQAANRVKQYFTRLERAMPEVNRKQAMIPETAVRLDNDWGTAPGFALQEKRCWFAFVPGVPYEMRNIFRERIQPELYRRFDLRPWRLVTLRTVGIGESGIQQKLMGLEFPEGVTLSFRTGSLENQTKLLFRTDFPESKLRQFVEKVSAAIGKQVFSIDGLDGKGQPLVEVIATLISSAGQSLTVTESVSGGQIASRCANREWFVEGTVIPDIPSLFKRYDCHPPNDLNKEDAMLIASEQLAVLLRASAQTDIALMQLWNQDFESLHDKDRTILLYTALATPKGCFHYRCRSGGPAPRKQIVAANVALDMLRRFLQNRLR